MKSLLLILLITLSTTCGATAYLGANYGYDLYSSDTTEEYKLNQKGTTYGGFIGLGKDFVGLEGIFQKFEASGKIKHDGGKYDYTSNAHALGAALRFSFTKFYLRFGLARYTVDQSLDIDDATTLRTANAVYDIQEGVSQNGSLMGLGLHTKLGSSVWVFLDYTRYQMGSLGKYDALSLGISFNLSGSLVDFGKI